MDILIVVICTLFVVCAWFNSLVMRTVLLVVFINENPLLSLYRSGTGNFGISSYVLGHPGGPLFSEDRMNHCWS